MAPWVYPGKLHHPGCASHPSGSSLAASSTPQQPCPGPESVRWHWLPLNQWRILSLLQGRAPGLACV